MTELEKVLLNHERGGYTRAGLMIELMKLGVVWHPELLKREMPKALLPEFRAFLGNVCESGRLPIMVGTLLVLQVNMEAVSELRNVFERD